MCFKDRNLVLTLLEVEKTKIKVLTGFVSGERKMTCSNRVLTAGTEKSAHIC